MPSTPPDPVVAIAPSIRCILSDIDGVWTDGRIIYDSSGCESKQFHVRDGLAIKLWMASGMHFGVITARQSPMVDRRCQELGIDAISQGRRDKWTAAGEMMASFGVEPNETCYIGDDLPDLAVLREVGFAVAPADAADDVCQAADLILATRGGHGTIRELVERLMRATSRWPRHEGSEPDPSC